MSINAYLRRISQAELAHVQANPEHAFTLVTLNDRALFQSGHMLDLDWSWQALDFMLNHASPYAQSPACRAILGGTLLVGPTEELPDEPPILLLSVEEVAQIAQALQAVPAEVFRDHIHAAELYAAQIPPRSWWSDDAAAQEALMPFYQDFVHFFAQAAAAHEAVLVRFL